MSTMHTPRPALVAAAVLGACAAALAGELRAGAAAVNITPRLGTTINGGVGPGKAAHVHDELFAKSLVLDDGATRLAYVLVDTCVIDREVFDAAKAIVKDRIALPPERVMMSCSHTHSGGAVVGAHLVEADAAYRAWIPGQLADSVLRAVNNLAPAKLAWGAGSLPGEVFCRRLKLKEGATYVNQLGVSGEGAKMNWDSPHAADGDPAGPVDPEISVIAVVHADGRPLALLANYSLHYVGGVGPGHISADYYGAFADRVQELLGADRQDPPFVAMLSNGTSGDINNIDPRTAHPAQEPYAQIRRVAGEVADEVLRVVKPSTYRADVTLAAAQTECAIATRRPSPEEVARAKEIVGARPVSELHSWQENYARETLILAEYPETVALPLQAFRIGGVAIAGWPGEIFAASGLALKQRSPLKPLFNIELANGWYGYIPPPEQFALGAYETWRARTSFLETRATEKMLDAFVGLLAGLK